MVSQLFHQEYMVGNEVGREGLEEAAGWGRRGQGRQGGQEEEEPLQARAQ